HIDYIAVYIPCIVKKSPAPVVPQGDLIHIVNVTTSVNGGGNKVTATAVVTILDNKDAPVENAEVSGNWSGAASKTFDKQKTDDEGRTDPLVLKNVDYNSGTLTFTFTVNGVTYPPYTWDNITKAGTVKYPL
ncbi:MAG: hypothetical protein PHT13_14000, partial [Methanosarcina sp.]|nr:hypothetical protein [Methanosarcina sp.]